MKTYNLWINTVREWVPFFDMGHEKAVKKGEINKLSDKDIKMGTTKKPIARMRLKKRICGGYMYEPGPRCCLWDGFGR